MRKTIAIAALGLLGACTVVEKTGEDITIEHAANQFIVAFVRAVQRQRVPLRPAGSGEEMTAGRSAFTP